MNNIPAGSTLFVGTEVWGPSDPSMYGGGGMQGGEPNANHTGEDINMVDDAPTRVPTAGAIRLDPDRPEGSQLSAKRFAVATPARDAAHDAHMYAEAQQQKAKTATREKKELEVKLLAAEQMNADLKKTNEEWEGARKQWEGQWEAFTRQRDLQFKAQLETQRKENMEHLLRQMNAELDNRAAESRKKVFALEQKHELERQKMLVDFTEQTRVALEKKQADYDIKLAAFHARHSSQRQQGPRPTEMDDIRFPDAAPTRQPQFIPPVTRAERQVEAIIRDTPGRLPIVSMTAPAHPESSAEPQTSVAPERNAAGINLDDPGVQELLRTMVRETMAEDSPSPKKSTRSKRKPGAQAILTRVRKDQQQGLSEVDDLMWKQVVRESFRLNTGLDRAKDFHDYQSVTEEDARRCEVGEKSPPEGSCQLYFGFGWANSLWNKQVLETLIQKLLKARAKDSGHYEIPDVAEGYILALFVNRLKDARGQWALYQPRTGESSADALERATAYMEDRRERNVGTSRKKSKFDVRRATTDKMLKISAAKQDHPAAATWKWLGEELLDQLEVGGMSSEEDEPMDVQCGNQVVVMTAHKISICPWRLVKVANYLEVIDKATDARRTKKIQKRIRVRGQRQSMTEPPLGLPRALYDADWLAQQKKYIPDVEEELEISEKEMTLMEIAVSN
ncbi:hypothetical protein C8R44DRAFT_886384 [Mycena epipterygia]|nr:hypothetical protein C8R44DRAFT_886384 [Mycena epipterygia]